VASDSVAVSADRTFGDRVQAARIRRGLTREAVAALCGRSVEWLKAIERGRSGTSLKMVTRLAEVLRVNDLTDLLGEDAPTAVYARPEHAALSRVRLALSSYGGAGTDVTLDDLQSRVQHAWRLRAVSTRDRTDLATVLPGLLADGQRAVSVAPTPARKRAAWRTLAEVYHLGQLYLCYQDAPELLWVVVDRGMSAALASEEPAAVGRAVWFSAYLYRDFGRIDQAHQVVDDGLRMLQAASGRPQVTRQRCVVHLASAWNYAREARPAQAWRAWDAAVEADRNGIDVPEPYVLFGADCGDVALVLDVELGKASSASRRAEAMDVETVGSVPRRTRLMIEASRGQMLKREYAGAVHLLRRAHQTSPEATVYSAYARAMAHELLTRSGPMLRRQVAELATDLGITAAA
jgi:transcriptional regulator with XRE-family HTH domain